MEMSLESKLPASIIQSISYSLVHKRKTPGIFTGGGGGGGNYDAYTGNVDSHKGRIRQFEQHDTHAAPASRWGRRGWLCFY